MKQMNKNGVSPVIGVILMIAITVAIAATVYNFVKIQLDQPESEPIFITGIFQGYYDDGTDPLIISGKEYNVCISDSDLEYLGNFLGLNTTFVFREIDSRYYDYEFLGAYLTMEESK